MEKSYVRNILCLLIVWNQSTYIIAQFRDHHQQPYFEHEDDSHHHHFDEPTNTYSQKAINPCHPSYYRFISNQPQRSYNYRLGSSQTREQVLCDRDLSPGWYRFRSLAGDTIPTSCPGVNYCGTRAPVWMKGTLPTTEEGIVKASGCVSVQGKCCTTQIPMLVRNCSDFIVYHLQPTPACPSAYCAGYEVPCPAGLSSDTGYTPCHFPVDLLETKVSYGLSKDGTQIQFFCDVTLGGQVVPESVALEVEWLADEEVIQSETFGLLQQHKGVLKEEKWSIGQTLQCRARARHTSINTFTSIITSPPLNTGVIITSPPSLTVNEGADPVYVELQTHIPITCPPKKKKKEKKTKGKGKEKEKEEQEKKEEEQEEPEEEECCVTLEVSTRGSNTPRCADGSLFDLVVLNSCSYKICADEWNLTHKVPVWAVNDGLIGGPEGDSSEPSLVYLDIRTVEPSPPRWQDYNLPTQEIHITHGDVQERCMIDDVISTFDGLKYRNQIEGIFVLYRHVTQPYEVQVQLKKCNQRALCICAAAVRFGDAMLAADLCSTGKLRFWSYTSDGSYIEPTKLSHLPQIVRIDEGRSFQIQFPSGTRVNMGPNLRFITVQASLPDLEQTTGLCGSFDRDLTNDLATYRGQVVCPANTNFTAPCDDFSKSWRLIPDQSLFVGTFNNEGLHLDEESHVDDSLSPGHCSCSGLKKPSTVELRPKVKSKFSNYPYEEYQPEEQNEEEQEKDKDKCYTTQCVDPRGADVTVQLLELVLDEDFAFDEENFGRNSESAVLTPVFQGDNNSIIAQKSTKKEWTDDEAEVFCLRMIEGVPTAKLCRDIAQVDVDIHTKACKHEVLHTKSAIWSMDALEQLRWECRDQVYHNISVWEPQLGRQHGTPPLGVLSSLCLNNCSGVGSCENGQCRCQSGFSGSDCSVNINLPPRISYLSNKGVCDIRNKPCGEILVWGERFADHSTIKCHFDIYRTQTVKSVPVLSGTLNTNGKLLTYQSIICDVPELPIHDAKIASFYIPGEGLDKTRTLMRLSLSYGVSNPRSSPLDYTIYDSLCWACDIPLNCQPNPTQSCNVLSEPFGTASDPFLSHSPFNNGPTYHSPIPLQLSPDTSGFNSHQPVLHPRLSSPCALDKDPGPCKDDLIRYYYDISARKCRAFIFGGCSGNANNFETEASCVSSCSSQTGNVGGILSSSSEGQSVKSTFDIRPLENLPQICTFKVVADGCVDDEQIQFYFDLNQRKCKAVIGCPGSLNFVSKELCMKECEFTT